MTPTRRRSVRVSGTEYPGWKLLLRRLGLGLVSVVAEDVLNHEGLLLLRRLHPLGHDGGGGSVPQDFKCLNKQYMI